LLHPNDVSRHAFAVAVYLFEANVPVSDGEKTVFEIG
jgi:hypothetical protein